MKIDWSSLLRHKNLERSTGLDNICESRTQFLSSIGCGVCAAWSLSKAAGSIREKDRAVLPGIRSPSPVSTPSPPQAPLVLKLTIDYFAWRLPAFHASPPAFQNPEYFAPPRVSEFFEVHNLECTNSEVLSGYGWSTITLEHSSFDTTDNGCTGSLSTCSCWSSGRLARLGTNGCASWMP